MLGVVIVVVAVAVAVVVVVVVVADGMTLAPGVVVETLETALQYRCKMYCVTPETL